MHNERLISEDFYMVGGNDRRISLFENDYPVTSGMSYNSYLVCDSKNILIDSVDSSIRDLLVENIKFILDDKKLDYIIINHMEPDHCAAFNELILLYPDIKFIGNLKTKKLLEQFYSFDVNARFICVKEGDTFSTGKHTFKFLMAPMVHWPEVMVTYDESTKVLFSADAFGTFGALNGALYHDEVRDKKNYIDESRRYYSNIVGKYGKNVVMLLNKIASLDISILCPLHGQIWRKNIDEYITIYKLWATYTPEDKAVCIVYGSIYNNTANAAQILAQKLNEAGINDTIIFDVASTHPSYILSEIFRCSNVVFACSTCNNEIFPPMETLIMHYLAHDIHNRKISLIQNGSWAPKSGILMHNLLEKAKDTEFIGETMTIKSTLKDENMPDLDQLCRDIVKSIE